MPSDSVFMILGSLIIAQGITKSGAENLIIRRLLGPFTGSNYSLIFGIIVICSFMAAIIPDHSVAAIMLPLVLTIADKTDIGKHKNEMVALVLAVAFSCSIAGLATPSGGARNVIAMGFLEEIYNQKDNLCAMGGFSSSIDDCPDSSGLLYFDYCEQGKLSKYRLLLSKNSIHR